MLSQQLEHCSYSCLLGVEIDTAAAHWPFVHNNDGIVVLRVKEEARVGQKMVLAHCHRYLVSTTIFYDGLNCC